MSRVSSSDKVQQYLQSLRECKDCTDIITSNKMIMYPLSVWVLEQAGLDNDVKIIISDIQDLDHVTQEDKMRVSSFNNVRRLCPYGLRMLADIIEPGSDIGGPLDAELMIAFADKELVPTILQMENYFMQIAEMIEKIGALNALTAVHLDLCK